MGVGDGFGTRCAMVLAVVGIVALPTMVAVAAPPDGCGLITARELERVLHVHFTPKPVGPSACLWLSDEADTASNTTISLHVFEGTTVGQVAVTIDGVTPTTKQMRTLAKAMAKRLR